MPEIKAPRVTCSLHLACATTSPFTAQMVLKPTALLFNHNMYSTFTLTPRSSFSRWLSQKWHLLTSRHLRGAVTGCCSERPAPLSCWHLRSCAHVRGWLWRYSCSDPQDVTLCQATSCVAKQACHATIWPHNATTFRRVTARRVVTQWQVHASTVSMKTTASRLFRSTKQSAKAPSTMVRSCTQSLDRTQFQRPRTLPTCKW